MRKSVRDAVNATPIQWKVDCWASAVARQDGDAKPSSGKILTSSLVLMTLLTGMLVKLDFKYILN